MPVSGDAARAVSEVVRPDRVATMRCDLVVAGGGMGGVAAALAGARAGLRTCLTEITGWLGGQMTAQGVSALDENRYIETTGATRSYQELRRRIRAAYPGAGANPGKCWVSALCFEPKVGVAALEAMLAPFEKSGTLRVMMRSTVLEAEAGQGRLQSVLVYDLANRRFTRLAGKVFIDATELGELLPLAGAAFRAGSDARKDTGEPEAEDAADPNALQSFTYPFVLANGGNDGAAPVQPPNYGRDKEQYNFVVTYPDGHSLTYGLFEKLAGTPGSFWEYRRLVAGNPDLAMINWPGNDVCDAGYLSRDPLAAARALQHGKQVSLGFAWWLHEQEPKLRLRADVMGTRDGVSQYPYIREARRMSALAAVREQDIAAPWQPGARGRAFDDTAGIGLYPIDIHGCSPRKPLPASKPYQIPMGALISSSIVNLLAGGKSIGTTHVTNGAYRLHPTEWAIGEASGTLAAVAVKRRLTPTEVYRDHAAMRSVQRELLRAGHPLIWFDDVTPEDADFFAMQWDALEGRKALAGDSLHARVRR